MILGLIALISNEDAKDEHPFPFIFTLIYILADVGSAFIALCTIAIARLC